MLEGVEEFLEQHRPDWVLVYGDTNSTLAGALAAAKLKIPVAHVEAGLRSRNRSMPEEINRILTDHLATLHFAPTEAAATNLRHEGIASDSIYHVGDVMYDAALLSASASAQSRIVEALKLRERNYILATLHRAENTDDVAKLTAIVEALIQMAKLAAVVFPMHPRTRKALETAGLLERLRVSVRILDALRYFDM
jgi:UDP-GlcNAc3NAcA epimerase